MPAWGIYRGQLVPAVGMVSHILLSFLGKIVSDNGNNSNSIPDTPQERAVVAVEFLREHGEVTTRQVAERCGMSRVGAWKMLDRLSRVLALVCVDGKWQKVNDDN